MTSRDETTVPATPAAGAPPELPPPGAVPGALDVPGTWNARDVGGRAAPAGSDEPLRTGVLLRTASLSRLTPAGQTALVDLGARTVVDLRGEDELARDGADAVPGGVRVLRRGMDPTPGLVDGGAGSGASADPAALVAGLLAADDPAAVARRLMHGVYATFVTDPGIRETVGRVLADVAAADGASVVHCSAGKDRTGWVVALVQYVAGVPEQERMAEYLASAAAAEGLAAFVPPLPGLSPEALAPVLTVEPAYLEGAWELAVREHGSIDDYLVACGVTTAVRDALVARLVAS
ncbi:tyrosine-protein phosphatase [Cellulosimicrobium sp. TH-20]|uniref:tyrosine-protein phosphatase n=1 Tax=Cellulosimicrobium sp. TH-20 TaxID=1980001 RepID=UPI0015822672